MVNRRLGPHCGSACVAGQKHTLYLIKNTSVRLEKQRNKKKHTRESRHCYVSIHQSIREQQGARMGCGSDTASWMTWGWVDVPARVYFGALKQIHNCRRRRKDVRGHVSLHDCDVTYTSLNFATCTCSLRKSAPKLWPKLQAYPHLCISLYVQPWKQVKN